MTLTTKPPNTPQGRTQTPHTKRREEGRGGEAEGGGRERGEQREVRNPLGSRSGRIPPRPQPFKTLAVPSYTREAKLLDRFGIRSPSMQLTSRSYKLIQKTSGRIMPRKTHSSKTCFQSQSINLADMTTWRTQSKTLMCDMRFSRMIQV